jgi:hypothetical protein
MLSSTELLANEGILFFSAILFGYWFARTLVILTRTEEEINSVLDTDMWWARRFWLSV